MLKSMLVPSGRMTKSKRYGLGDPDPCIAQSAKHLTQPYSASQRPGPSHILQQRRQVTVIRHIRNSRTISVSGKYRFKVVYGVALFDQVRPLGTVDDLSFSHESCTTTDYLQYRPVHCLQATSRTDSSESCNCFSPHRILTSTKRTSVLDRSRPFSAVQCTAGSAPKRTSCWEAPAMVSSQEDCRIDFVSKQSKHTKT